jgi:16S rRNA (uracil1498-N3)-methyltransferase
MKKRLHLSPLAAGPRRIAGEDHHYLSRVLRVRSGDSIVVFDGAGREADARVVSITEDALELEIGEPRAGTVGARITLLCALLKGDRMDLVIQKATELGVARIVPLAAERAVVKIDPRRAGDKLERWEKIAREAARQCERADAPAILPVLPVADAVRGHEGAFGILFHEGERAASLRALLPTERPGQVICAVGPEGGFTPAEVDAARGAGFAVCGLGPRILRAETAAIAAVAILGYALGDLA